MDRISDADGVSVDSNNERGLRELVKEDYSKESAKNPMGGSFRAVRLNAHNLENVSGLRDKYPWQGVCLGEFLIMIVWNM